MALSKKEISLTIPSKLGISKKDSLEIVNSFFNFLTKKSTNHINIHRFGSFIPKKTPKRIGRNPHTKEVFEIKEREKVSFRCSDQIKKSIN